MFGIRTPAKRPSAASADSRSPPSATKTAGPSAKTVQPSKVRRSVGEWEAGDTENTKNTPPRTPTEGPPEEPEQRAPGPERNSPQQAGRYASKVTEARTYLIKAKAALGTVRLSGTVKAEVTKGLDRLYQMVKELDAENRKGSLKEKDTGQGERKEGSETQEMSATSTRQINTDELERKLEENLRRMEESGKRMEELKETMERVITAGAQTYASAAASQGYSRRMERPALHSVVVTSTDEKETGEDVIGKIRGAIDAKESGLQVERIRKAKDRKIIVSCRTEEERRKVKDKLRGTKILKVEEIKNKNPLVILKDVLAVNNDEDVQKALLRQNRTLMEHFTPEELNMTVVYRKKTRNPHLNHIVMRVTTKMWKTLTEAGTVHIDLKRVHVEDQSPLIQCSTCLAYGHSGRYCKETQKSCSHCGGLHTKAECPDFTLGTAATCCNCVRAKHEKTDHSAFSWQCAVRQKWDALARATIAYC